MRKTDGFQVIEYIRSSIEIIMNLKVEDLEREIHGKSKAQAHETSIDGGCDSLNSSSLSINPQSFVLASMKEALAAASSVRQHVNHYLPSKVNSTGAGLI